MNKNVKELLVLLIVFILVGLCGFGFGLLIRQQEIEKQTYINTQLELEYNDLRSAYEWLEKNTFCD